MRRRADAGSEQLGLFASARVSRSFDHGRRVELGGGSWVEHFPGWLTETAELFTTLAALPSWEQRSRWMFTQTVEEPRLTAEIAPLSAAPAALVVVGDALSRHYGVRYDSVWMNLYRDEHDSTAWHADRPVNRAQGAIVPVLSMGATRRFLIRRQDGGPSTRFTVEAGDLIVMGGRCQRDWVHCVPKETQPRGPRISVNFGSSEQTREASAS